MSDYGDDAGEAKYVESSFSSHTTNPYRSLDTHMDFEDADVRTPSPSCICKEALTPIWNSPTSLSMKVMLESRAQQTRRRRWVMQPAE